MLLVKRFFQFLAFVSIFLLKEGFTHDTGSFSSESLGAYVLPIPGDSYLYDIFSRTDRQILEALYTDNKPLYDILSAQSMKIEMPTLEGHSSLKNLTLLSNENNKKNSIFIYHWNIFNTEVLIKTEHTSKQVIHLFKSYSIKKIFILIKIF